MKLTLNGSVIAYVGTAPLEQDWTHIRDVTKRFAESGYVHHDVVTATAADAERFAKWHTHSEDEVRYAMEAKYKPVFSFLAEGGSETLDVEIGIGDFLVIPAGVTHRFSGEGTFARFFKNDKGWEPLYREIL